MNRTHTKQGLLFSLTFILFFVGMNRMNSQTADFSVNKNIGCNKVFAFFKDESTGASSWYWDFGNKNTSILQNPQVIYNKPGKYTVSLTINGGADKEVKEDFIIVVKPEAIFNIADENGCKPKTVEFSDHSTTTYGNIVSWIWIFGDGNVSFDQNPTHTYNIAGSFDVSLMVTDDNGCENDFNTDPVTVHVINNPIADFQVDKPTGCSFPHEVKFINTTKIPGTSNIDDVITEWQWDFGDGNASNEKNPTHTYESAGNFTVTLRARGGDCSDEVTKVNVVNVYNNTVDFSVDKDNICLGDSVHFTSTSSNVASWEWDFGEGDKSEKSNPYYKYVNEGTYDIILDVTFTNGCKSSVQKQSYIEVSGVPSAYFTPDQSFTYGPQLDVNFTNKSTNGSTFLWEFGDGTSSSEESPVHNYTGFGTYLAKLTVTNGNCEDSYMRSISLKEPELFIDELNDVFPKGGCVPQEEGFYVYEDEDIDESLSVFPYIESYYWTFGDGNTSTDEMPLNNFLIPGEYQVNCRVTLNNGYSFSAVPDTVAYGDKKNVEFTVTQTDSCYTSGLYIENLTAGIDSLAWHCAGATIARSVDKPADNRFYQHCFSRINYHDATLEVWDRGCKSEKTEEDIVFIKAPIAEFKVSKSNFCDKPGEFRVYNSSQGVENYRWTMGDGTTLTTPPSQYSYNNYGNYNITCYTENLTTGCSHSDQQDIHVHKTVAAFSANKTEGCFPQTVQFTDNSSTTGNITSWSWRITMHDFPSWVPDWWLHLRSDLDTERDTVIYEQNPSFIFKYPGEYDITLTVREYWGCIETIQKINHIIIYDDPHVSFNADRPNACQDEEITFNDNSTADNPISERRWNFDGTTVSNQVTASHIFAGTGIKPVSLYIKDSKGCYSTLNKSVNIHAPEADFDVRDVGCRNSDIPFNDESEGVGLSYTWGFGDGASSHAANPYHSYSSTGTYDISLEVTDAYGCSDVADEQTLEIIEPVAEFSASETDLGCASTAPPVQFYDQSSSDIFAWRWDFGDGNTSYLAEPTHRFPPGDWAVSLKVYSTTGCAREVIKNDLIHVEGPVGSISTSGSDGCNPLDVTFTATTSAVDDITWDFGDGSILSNDFTPTHTYTESRLFYPYMTLTDNNGCQFAYDGEPVTVAEAPAVEFSSTTNYLCEKNEITFINQSYIPPSPVPAEIESFLWTFGDGTTSSELNPTIVYDSFGTYDVSLTVNSTEGCSTTLLKPLYVNIFKSTADADFEVSDNVVCPWENVIFTDQSDTRDVIAAWEWDFGDSTMSTIQDPEHVFSGDSALYKVNLKVTNQDGCWDTITRFVEMKNISADFEAEPVSGSSPLVTQFTDKSKSDDDFISWIWDFGEGGTSTEQDPEHTFVNDNNKSFNIQLIAETDAGCIDTIVKENLIEPYNKPVIAVNDTFYLPEDTTIRGSVAGNDIEPDGQVLTYILVSGKEPEYGEIQINNDGMISYTPEPGYYGIDSCRYRVCDSGTPATCDEALVVFYIESVNDPGPLAVDDFYTSGEGDSLFAETVLKNDIDNEMLGLIPSLMKDPENGTIEFNEDGTFIYVPQGDFNGTDYFIYRICDKGDPSECSSARVEIRVAAVHYPPVANNDDYSVDEDRTATLKPLLNDTDKDDDLDNTSLEITTLPKHGETMIKANGFITYTPAPSYFGEDSLFYAIFDMQGNSDSAWIYIHVINENDPPVAVTDTVYSIPGNLTSCFVLVNDYDNDNDLDSTSIRVSIQPRHGKIQSIEKGVVKYIAPDDYIGTDKFRYQISDHTGLFDTAFVHLIVTKDVPKPDAIDDNFVTNEEEKIDINVISNDIIFHMPTIRLKVIQFPFYGNIIPQNGKGLYTYAPKKDFTGTDKFKYTLTDHMDQIDTAVVTIEVSNVPDPPVATDDELLMLTNTPSTFNVLMNDFDIDGDLDSSSVIILSKSQQCEIDVVDIGNVNIIPENEYTGLLFFEYEISDLTGLKDTAFVQIEVSNELRAPDARDDYNSLLEDTNIDFNVLINDTVYTGNKPRIRMIQYPSHGGMRAHIYSGDCMYDPDLNFTGLDTAIYQLWDPSGMGDTAYVYFEVKNVPDPPDAKNDVVTVLQNHPFDIKFLKNDSDPDNDIQPDRSVIIEKPGHGKAKFEKGTNSISYISDLLYEGFDEIIYKIFDETGLSDSAKIDIKVKKSIFKPSARNDKVKTEEDVPVLLSIRDNDTIYSGNEPDFRILEDVTNGQLIYGEIPGVYTYVPDSNFYGTDRFKYELIDPVGLKDTALGIIEVETIPDPPVAVNDTFILVMNFELTGNILANDYDIEQDIDFEKTRILSTAFNCDIKLNEDYSIQIAPYKDFVGHDSLLYIIEDFTGLRDTAMVLLNILAPFEPVAVNDTVTMDEDTQTDILIVLNDTLPNNESFSIHIHSNVKQGAVSLLQDNTTRYIPLANYFGTDSFEYIISTQSGLYDTAKVIININNTMDMLIANDDEYKSYPFHEIIADVISNDIDFDKDIDTSSLAIANMPDSGKAEIFTDGSIHYIPNLGFTGRDSLVYHLSDKTGNRDTAVVHITILPPEKPVAVDDNVSTGEDTPVKISMQENDKIPAVDTSYVSILSATKHGSIDLTTSMQECVYAPNSNYFGPDSFTYVLHAQSGLTDTAKVSIDVKPIEDPPFAVRDTVYTRQGHAVNFNFSNNISDPEDNVNFASVVIFAKPVHGQCEMHDAESFHYKPDKLFLGTDSMKYSIQDFTHLTGYGTLIIITLPAEPPVANDDDYYFDEDTELSGDFVQNDFISGQDTFFVSILSYPKNGDLTLSGKKGKFTYKADDEHIRQDLFSYILYAESGLSDTAIVYLTIKPVNDPPVAVDDTYTVQSDTENDLTPIGNDYDVENDLDTVGIEIITLPIHGKANKEIDGSITYVSDIGYLGKDSIVYSICDHEGLCDEATIYLSIIENKPPVALNDTVETNEDTPVDISNLFIISNDSDERFDMESLRIFKDVSKGVLQETEDGFTYAPDENYYGQDKFEYEICDHLGQCDRAKVHIIIHPIDDPPRLRDDSTVINMRQGTIISEDITEYFEDPENELDYDNIIVKKPSGQGGEITVENGVIFIDYSGRPAFTGEDEIIVEVCDESGNCTEATLRFYIESYSSIIKAERALSPNNDGVNDVLEFKHLEEYPDNKIIIFNRWGTEVYKQNRYNNDWCGKSRNGNTYLPDGTYYYLLFIHKTLQPIKGYVYLKTNK